MLEGRGPEALPSGPQGQRFISGPRVAQGGSGWRHNWNPHRTPLERLTATPLPLCPVPVWEAAWPGSASVTTITDVLPACRGDRTKLSARPLEPEDVQAGLGSTRRGGCPQGARGSQEASSVLGESSWPLDSVLFIPQAPGEESRSRPGLPPPPAGGGRSVGPSVSSSCLSQIPWEWAPPSVHCRSAERSLSGRSSLPLWFGSCFYGRGTQANSFPFGTVAVLLVSPGCVSSGRSLLTLFLLCNRWMVLPPRLL